METIVEKGPENLNMIVKRVSVPIGLEELMEGLTKEVLLKKPKDLYIFASEYFSRLVLLREGSNYKPHPVRTAQSVTRLRPAHVPTEKLNKPIKQVTRETNTQKSPSVQEELKKSVRQRSKQRFDSTVAKPVATQKRESLSIRNSVKKEPTPRSVQTTPRESRHRSSSRESQSRVEANKSIDARKLRKTDPKKIVKKSEALANTDTKRKEAKGKPGDKAKSSMKNVTETQAKKLLDLNILATNTNIHKEVIKKERKDFELTETASAENVQESTVRPANSETECKEETNSQDTELGNKPEKQISSFNQKDSSYEKKLESEKIEIQSTDAEGKKSTSSVNIKSGQDSEPPLSEGPTDQTIQETTKTPILEDSQPQTDEPENKVKRSFSIKMRETSGSDDVLIVSLSETSPVSEVKPALSLETDTFELQPSIDKPEPKLQFFREDQEVDEGKIDKVEEDQTIVDADQGNKVGQEQHFSTASVINDFLSKEKENVYKVMEFVPSVAVVSTHDTTDVNKTPLVQEESPQTPDKTEKVNDHNILSEKTLVDTQLKQHYKGDESDNNDAISEKLLNTEERNKCTENTIPELSFPAIRMSLSEFLRNEQVFASTHQMHENELSKETADPSTTSPEKVLVEQKQLLSNTDTSSLTDKEDSISSSNNLKLIIVENESSNTNTNLPSLENDLVSTTEHLNKRSFSGEDVEEINSFAENGVLEMEAVSNTTDSSTKITDDLKQTAQAIETLKDTSSETNKEINKTISKTSDIQQVGSVLEVIKDVFVGTQPLSEIKTFLNDFLQHEQSNVFHFGTQATLQPDEIRPKSSIMSFENNKFDGKNKQNKYHFKNRQARSLSQNNMLNKELNHSTSRASHNENNKIRRAKSGSVIGMNGSESKSKIPTYRRSAKKPRIKRLETESKDAEEAKIDSQEVQGNTKDDAEIAKVILKGVAGAANHLDLLKQQDDVKAKEEMVILKSDKNNLQENATIDESGKTLNENVEDVDKQEVGQQKIDDSKTNIDTKKSKAEGELKNNENLLFTDEAIDVNNEAIDKELSQNYQGRSLVEETIVQDVKSNLEELKEMAAVKIQSAWKGHNTRKGHKILSSDGDSSNKDCASEHLISNNEEAVENIEKLKEEEAAIKIQSSWKGYNTRKSKHNTEKTVDFESKADLSNGHKMSKRSTNNGTKQMISNSEEATQNVGQSNEEEEAANKIQSVSKDHDIRPSEPKSEHVRAENHRDNLEEKTNEQAVNKVASLEISGLENIKEAEEAAVKIQSAWKGYNTRKTEHIIEKDRHLDSKTIAIPTNAESGKVEAEEEKETVPEVFSQIKDSPTKDSEEAIETQIKSERKELDYAKELLESENNLLVEKNANISVDIAQEDNQMTKSQPDTRKEDGQDGQVNKKSQAALKDESQFKKCMLEGAMEGKQTEVDKKNTAINDAAQAIQKDVEVAEKLLVTENVATEKKPTNPVADSKTEEKDDSIVAKGDNRREHPAQTRSKGEENEGTVSSAASPENEDKVKQSKISDAEGIIEETKCQAVERKSATSDSIVRREDPNAEHKDVKFAGKPIHKEEPQAKEIKLEIVDKAENEGSSDTMLIEKQQISLENTEKISARGEDKANTKKGIVTTETDREGDSQEIENDAKDSAGENKFQVIENPAETSTQKDDFPITGQNNVKALNDFLHKENNEINKTELVIDNAVTNDGSEVKERKMTGSEDTTLLENYEIADNNNGNLSLHNKSELQENEVVRQEPEQKNEISIKESNKKDTAGENSYQVVENKIGKTIQSTKEKVQSELRVEDNEVQEGEKQIKDSKNDVSNNPILIEKKSAQVKEDTESEVPCSSNIQGKEVQEGEKQVKDNKNDGSNNSILIDKKCAQVKENTESEVPCSNNIQVKEVQEREKQVKDNKNDELNNPILLEKKCALVKEDTESEVACSNNIQVKEVQEGEKQVKDSKNDESNNPILIENKCAQVKEDTESEVPCSNNTQVKEVNTKVPMTKENNSEEKAALKIQSAWKGFIARKFMENKRSKELAIVKIQTFVRGFLDRKKLSKSKPADVDLKIASKTLNDIVTSDPVNQLEDDVLKNDFYPEPKVPEKISGINRVESRLENANVTFLSGNADKQTTPRDFRPENIKRDLSKSETAEENVPATSMNIQIQNITEGKIPNIHLIESEAVDTHGDEKQKKFNLTNKTDVIDEKLSPSNKSEPQTQIETDVIDGRLVLNNNESEVAELKRSNISKAQSIIDKTLEVSHLEEILPSKREESSETIKKDDIEVSNDKIIQQKPISGKDKIEDTLHTVNIVEVNEALLINSDLATVEEAKDVIVDKQTRPIEEILKITNESGKREFEGNDEVPKIHSNAVSLDKKNSVIDADTNNVMQKKEGFQSINHEEQALCTKPMEANNERENNFLNINSTVTHIDGTSGGDHKSLTHNSEGNKNDTIKNDPRQEEIREKSSIIIIPDSTSVEPLIIKENITKQMEDNFSQKDDACKNNDKIKATTTNIQDQDISEAKDLNINLIKSEAAHVIAAEEVSTGNGFESDIKIKTEPVIHEQNTQSSSLNYPNLLKQKSVVEQHLKDGTNPQIVHSMSVDERLLLSNKEKEDEEVKKSNIKNGESNIIDTLEVNGNTSGKLNQEILQQKSISSNEEGSGSGSSSNIDKVSKAMIIKSELAIVEDTMNEIVDKQAESVEAVRQSPIERGTEKMGERQIESKVTEEKLLLDTDTNNSMQKKAESQSSSAKNEVLDTKAIAVNNEGDSKSLNVNSNETHTEDTFDNNNKLETIEKERGEGESDEKSPRPKPDFYRADTVVEPLIIKKTMAQLIDETQDNSAQKSDNNNNNDEIKEETALEKEVRAAVHEIMNPDTNQAVESTTEAIETALNSLPEVPEHDIHAVSLTGELQKSPTSGNSEEKADAISLKTETESKVNDSLDMPTTDDHSSVSSVDSVVTVIVKPKLETAQSLTEPPKKLNVLNKALSTSALEDHVELLDQVQNTLLDQLSGKESTSLDKFDIDQLRKELHETAPLYETGENRPSTNVDHEADLMEYLYDFEPDDRSRDLPDIAEETETREDEGTASARFCGTSEKPATTSVAQALPPDVELIQRDATTNEIIIHDDNIQVNEASDGHDSLVIPATLPSELQDGAASGGLKPTGEYHDTVVVPLPSGADVKIKNASSQEGRRLVDSGNQTAGQEAAAGVEAVTSSSRRDGVERVVAAQASLKDTAPAGPGSDGSRRQFASQTPLVDNQAMDSETISSNNNNNNNNKRNNAINNKKNEKNMETEAATKIQAGFRGYQVRKQLKAKNAAIDQKRQLRKRSSRENVKEDNLEEKSAVKIQAGVRGFLVRRRQKKQTNSSASA